MCVYVCVLKYDGSLICDLVFGHQLQLISSSSVLISPLSCLHPSLAVFKGRTFLVLAQLDDTVAQIKASFLHILYEINRLDVHFRFRHRGAFWKDSQSLRVSA